MARFEVEFYLPFENAGRNQPSAVRAVVRMRYLAFRQGGESDCAPERTSAESLLLHREGAVGRRPSVLSATCQLRRWRTRPC